MSTYSIPISGSSSVLAMLHALVLKAARVARVLWNQISVTLTMVATASFSAAATMTTVLSTDEGYTLATQLAKTVIATGWKVFSKTVRFAGRVVRRLADVAVIAIGYTSGAAVDLAYTTVCTTAQKVEDGFNRADQKMRAFGTQVWQATRSAFVRSVATTGAGLAAAFTALRNLTEGALDEWLTCHLPRKISTRLLGQWSGLLAVTALTFIVILVGVIRGWVQRRKAAKTQTPVAPGGPEKEQEPEDEPKKEEEPEELIEELHEVPEVVLAEIVGPDIEDELAELDWHQLAATVTVDISPDGSVTVNGIPDWVPEHLREDVAHIAADAAIRQMRRTLKLRTTPNRDDRRLFTKVARQALRKQGKQHPKAA
jgi:hypothetical protein